MLGSSSNKLDACVKQAVQIVKPQTILELGCGQGKFGALLQQLGSTASLSGLQKLFSPQDASLLNKRGYQRIIDSDISQYDIAFYTQTGFAQMHYVYRYHMALIRGFMNPAVLPPFLT